MPPTREEAKNLEGIEGLFVGWALHVPPPGLRCACGDFGASVDATPTREETCITKGIWRPPVPAKEGWISEASVIPSCRRWDR